MIFLSVLSGWRGTSEPMNQPIFQEVVAVSGAYHDVEVAVGGCMELCSFDGMPQPPGHIICHPEESCVHTGTSLSVNLETTCISMYPVDYSSNIANLPRFHFSSLKPTETMFTALSKVELWSTYFQECMPAK